MTDMITIIQFFVGLPTNEYESFLEYMSALAIGVLLIFLIADMFRLIAGVIAPK